MPSVSKDRSPPRWPVAAFFVLSFGITWSLQLPAVLAKHGLLAGGADGYMPLALLGIFGPLVAATLVTAREGGRPALRALYAGLRKWRAPVADYFVALVLPGLLLTGVLGVMRYAGREGAIMYPPDAGRLVAAVVISLAEELGWRGFAQAHLQKRMSPFAASGVIGVLWTLWHIPMFLGAGVPLSLLPVMGLYFTGGSLLLAHLYNRAGGSILLALLAHLGAHLNNAHASLPTDVTPLLVGTVIYGALGLAFMRSRGRTGS